MAIWGTRRRGWSRGRGSRAGLPLGSRGDQRVGKLVSDTAMNWAPAEPPAKELDVGVGDDVPEAGRPDTGGELPSPSEAPPADREDGIQRREEPSGTHRRRRRGWERMSASSRTSHPLGRRAADEVGQNRLPGREVHEQRAACTRSNSPGANGWVTMS